MSAQIPTKQQLLRLTKKQLLTLGGYKNMNGFYAIEGSTKQFHSGRNAFGSKKHLAKIIAYELAKETA